MLIPCPVCGLRDAGEFSYGGDATVPRPPLEEEAAEPWIDYVYARRNPRGEHEEFWQHVHGCRQFLLVQRNTETHEVLGAHLLGPFGDMFELAEEPEPEAGAMEPAEGATQEAPGGEEIVMEEITIASASGEEIVAEEEEEDEIVFYEELEEEPEEGAGIEPPEDEPPAEEEPDEDEPSDETEGDETKKPEREE